MTYYLPNWALEAAAPEDRERAEQAYHAGTMQLAWPESGKMRGWAKQQGWPAPWFIFEGGFIKKMFESDENFALALNDSGIEMAIPVGQYKVPAEHLQELDLLYEERDDAGHPTSWGILVAGLRDIRRAVDAGVVVEVDGKKLNRPGSFYSWAHGRYPLLEDGYDSWIGDDDS